MFSKSCRKSLSGRRASSPAPGYGWRQALNGRPARHAEHAKVGARLTNRAARCSTTGSHLLERRFVRESFSMSAPKFKVLCFIRFIEGAAPYPRWRTLASRRARPARTELRKCSSRASCPRSLQDPDERSSTTHETVQVEGERQLAPVSVGLMAIPWAIIHPTQAWRILMPVQDAK